MIFSSLWNWLRGSIYLMSPTLKQSTRIADAVTRIADSLEQIAGPTPEDQQAEVDQITAVVEVLADKLAISRARLAAAQTPPTP